MQSRLAGSVVKHQTVVREDRVRIPTEPAVAKNVGVKDLDVMQLDAERCLGNGPTGRQ